jgi:serine/threonine protein kinase/tetratricopeptide (TPR) repeat protein
MSESIADVKSIFGHAVERGTPAEREAYLAEVCADNPQLRSEVESLLQAQGSAHAFFQDINPGGAAAMDVQSLSVCTGAVIGPYKLLEQVGEGGMGLVFLAEQTQPIRRKVALKVIKPGMDTRQVIARFEAERQALALMDHPNIAKVLDAGATEVGRPYFVMELVRGVPITEYCDQHSLSLRQRLELFVQVCQAVQHAHQKGIIHRDLKPTNVLVAHDDTVPLPKIIDFGIAKATTQDLTEHTLFTGIAQVLGTPMYMSPEQAALHHRDVDTRSDIYALGVLLYELLTGATPFEKERLKRANLEEVRRIIQEEEPPRPSARVSTLGAELSTVSERRRVEPERMSLTLRGELDWIVLKALEKDRNRRYESASALAADVQRYLNDEAVEACPPSSWYRVRKFARRHRTTLVMVGIVALALMATTAVSVWQTSVAQDALRQSEKDRKQAETDRKQAETDRKQAETDRNRAETDRDAAKDAQKAAKIAEGRAADEAAIATAVNDFFLNDLLRQATSVSGDERTRTDDPYLSVKEALDRAAARIGQRFQGQPLVEAAIRTTIGQAYNGLTEHSLALPHLERAVQLREKHLGPGQSDTLTSMDGLAIAYSWTGRHKDAIALRDRILACREATCGRGHIETLACLGNLAGAYEMAGDWKRSTLLWNQVLGEYRVKFGPTDPATLGAKHNLANCYLSLDRLQEAQEIYQEILDATPKPEDQVYCKLCFAYACQQAGKLDQGERLLREALDISRKRVDVTRRLQTANAQGWLARNLLLQNRYVEAETHARDALEYFEKQKRNNPRRFYWMSLLGEILVAQKKYEEAEPLLLQGYEGMKQREFILPASEKLRLPELIERVCRYYELTMQAEKARVWREKLSNKNP